VLHMSVPSTSGADIMLAFDTTAYRSALQAG
jgi:hypothetical protein